jgi:lipoate-protein ligase B
MNENLLPDPRKPGTALVCRLGLISFPDAMEVEHALIKLRHQETVADTLLIFEHPPTITLGRMGGIQSVLVTPGELEARGIALYNSDRGGDATYNCPGQLVIHPIVNLRLKGARAHIADLEEVVLRVLLGYGIAAERSPEHPGIWVGGRQIGAVGLRFSRGISMHGISLNVNPDLSLFRFINLCGLPGKSAASIENELGYAVPIAEVEDRIEGAYSDVFHSALSPISRERLFDIIRNAGNSLI